MGTPILDLYDDSRSEVLLTLLPSVDDVPDFIKEASTVSADDPDHCYALVMLDGDGRKMRKYAHMDSGNTALSVMYFLERRHVLPEELRKHAAHNLVAACEEHGILPPGPLVKEACLEGMSPLHDPAIHRAEFLEEPPETAVPTHSVEGIPLDSYEEVKQASAWFDENCCRLHPSQRRPLALGIEKRASAIGLEISEDLRRYAGDGYARDMGVAMAARELLLEDHPDSGVYTELQKRAAYIDPEVFAESVAEIDTALGLDSHWDRDVPDPWASTFDKTAEKSRYVHTDGVDKVTEDDLIRLAQNGLPQLKKYFAEDMVQGFAKSPVTVFKSLPAPVKTTIMRMARDENHPPL